MAKLKSKQLDLQKHNIKDSARKGSLLKSPNDQDTYQAETVQIEELIQKTRPKAAKKENAMRLKK